MPTTTRRPVPAVVIALTALASCNRSKAPGAPPTPAAQLELEPAAAARTDLAAEFVLPNADRTLATVGSLARKLGLPFGEAELRQMLSAKTNLPAGLIERIDLAKPLGVALIITAKKPEKPDADAAQPVLAVALKDPSAAGFEAYVTSAGKVVERKLDAVRVQPGGDAGGGLPAMWLVPRDGAVCAADSLENLVAGAALALEARKKGGTDLWISLLPEAVARASGTTLKAAMAKARNELAAGPPKAGRGKDAELQASANKSTLAVFDWMLEAVEQTREVHVALGLDADQGMSTALEFLPVAGSALAKTLSVRHPYALEPGIAAGSPTMVMATGDSSWARTMFEKMRDPLLQVIPAAERAKAGATFASVMDAVSGPLSARLSFEGQTKLAFQYDVVYTLKPGTDG